MHATPKHQVSNAVDTIRRRMQRSEEFALNVTTSGHQAVAADPSSISHVHFAALSSRLAQVSAKASADSTAAPARAHDPLQMDLVMRFLSDVRQIADTIAGFATGDVPPFEAGDL